MRRPLDWNPDLARVAEKQLVSSRDESCLVRAG
jgi:hypothetical protein